MSGQYYIRVRGEVKGPLTEDQIRAQIRRKRLGKHHELSTDAVNWQKAGDMAEFFEPVVASRPALQMDEEPHSIETSTASSSVAQQPSPGGSTEWYYAKGGNKLGPVAGSELQMWLASGHLSPTDLVWNESFDNWVPAGDLPQFASAALGARKTSKKSEHDPAGFFEIFFGLSRAANLPENAIHKFPSLSRYLRIAELFLRTLFVVSLLLNLSGWFLQTGLAVSNEQWAIAFGAFIGALAGIFFLWLIFVSGMAVLELVRVIIKIEDNTASVAETGR